MANYLTSQGKTDLKNLGNRIKTAFPDFLEITDNSNIDSNFWVSLIQVMSNN